MSQNNRMVYGGQAVIEGVMFAGRSVHVTAVRRKNHEIEFFEVPRNDRPWVRKLGRIPFIRGLVAIVDSSSKGSRHLNYSIEKYGEEQSTEDSANRKAEKEEKTNKAMQMTLMIGVAFIGLLSFLLGKLMFNVLPAVLEDVLLGSFFKNVVVHNLIEGVIKILLIIVYIYIISLTPIVKRLFQYHGAEHKVISAYESGVELTVENVQKFNTLHYRCGSSFIVLTVIIGVIIYAFIPYDNLLQRVLERIIFLPVVISISYEVLRFTNSLRDTPVLRYLGYPGLWLQKLTTKEPFDDQVEVSIASFNRVRELDEQYAQGLVPAYSVQGAEAEATA